MSRRRLAVSDDFVLIVIVCAIWIALAALYGLVPMFDMPGSARVWGSGGVLFAVLAGLIMLADRRARHSGDGNEVSRGAEDEADGN